MFRDEILTLARNAIHHHPESIDDATAELLSAIKKHPDFKKEIDRMAHDYAQRAIWTIRRTVNQGLRNSTKRGDSPAKVVVYDSSVVQQVCKNIYDKYIDGRRLGSIFGRELPEIIRDQRMQAKGHSENAAFFAKLVKHVPENKTVEQSITSKRLTDIYRSVLQPKAEAVGV